MLFMTLYNRNCVPGITAILSKRRSDESKTKEHD